MDIARLLGMYNILPVEIRSLDPSRNTSVLRLGEYDLRGEYYPGHLKGDQVHLLVTPRQLRACPRENRRMPDNCIPADLERAVHVPDGIRLEFAGGLQVEAPRGSYTQAKEWTIEFPSHGLRIL